MLGLPYTLSQIAEIAGALDLFQGEYAPRPLRYLSFDTRTIHYGADTVFIALPTSNRDGHEFVKAAHAKGVCNFIVDRPLTLKGINYVLADDCWDLLHRWARAHRQRFRYPVIGITGSNGKTTVKEWLTILLESTYTVVKSPMSYNSRLGVPLSLLRLHPQADFALIEAGISQRGEMALLREMIAPDIGILTHMGPAHDAGFQDQQEKLAEKCLLFEGVQQLLLNSEQASVFSYVSQLGIPTPFTGSSSEASLQELKAQETLDGWTLQVKEGSETYSLPLSVSGEAARENALLALLAARKLGVDWESLQHSFPQLYPIRMRTELITDNPEITLINDAYNSDIDSIRNAVHLLLRTQSHPYKCMILSDLGNASQDLHQQILAEITQLLGADQLITVGPVFSQLHTGRRYANTQQLIQHFSYEEVRDHVVLLKGARPYQLERLLPLLNPKLNDTWLRIDLNALRHNFQTLKNLLPSGVKTMAMVKAAAYGSGTWEIAQVLESAGADYLAVAYASEGIHLRQAGIQLPIMVLNAATESIPTLIQYDIEPEVYSLDFLQQYLRHARLSASDRLRIHLKLETGMGRLGFIEAELPELIALLLHYPEVQVISVLSHLAAADDPAADTFTHTQIQQFQHMYGRLQAELGLYAFRHILNTAGLIRFPAYAMEMVRMGIGLYGISPTLPPPLPLQEIGSLFTRISQIRSHSPGSPIGYGRAQTTTRPSQIATVPVGYADGIPRALGNGAFTCWVRGQAAPTFGRICMDMLMLDVTDIPEARVGDEVLIYGSQGETYQSVYQLAEAAGTIPYEILVGISDRVRRVYVKE